MSSVYASLNNRIILFRLRKYVNICNYKLEYKFVNGILSLLKALLSKSKSLLGGHYDSTQ